MSASQQPPGDGSRKPKPPPGVSEETHQPCRVALYDIVERLRQLYLDAKQPATVEDLICIVPPEVAAEMYAWAWRVKHPAVRCYDYEPNRISFVDYITNDLVGTIHGYAVMMSPIQQDGYVQLIPFAHLEGWKRQAAEAHASRCRTR